MSVDVDAVSERLNGLVALLQAVGIDAGDVDQVSKNLKNGAGAGGGATGGGGGGANRQLNDEQIEAIIKKLQAAQAEAPQIIAALEAHAEARSLTGKQQQSNQQTFQNEHQQGGEEDYDEDEEDDDFDENANYPMVGHGISDDISVVSDLTTPTVVSSTNIPDEEHYKETMPPMILGGNDGEGPPLLVGPSKQKNRVAPVRSRRPAPGSQQHQSNSNAKQLSPQQQSMVMIGQLQQQQQQQQNGGKGAAAARRNKYQSTMAKLQEKPSISFTGPSALPSPGTSASNKKTISPPSRSKKLQPKHSSSSTGSGANINALSMSLKKGDDDPDSAFEQLASSRSKDDWDQLSSNNNVSMAAWNAFEDSNKSMKKGTTVIDNDGFLIGDSFDPFNTGGDGGGGPDPFGVDVAGSNNNNNGSSGNRPSRARKRGKRASIGHGVSAGPSQQSSSAPQSAPVHAAAAVAVGSSSQSPRKERSSGGGPSGGTSSRLRVNRRASTGM